VIDNLGGWALECRFILASGGEKDKEPIVRTHETSSFAQKPRPFDLLAGAEKEIRFRGRTTYFSIS